MKDLLDRLGEAPGLAGVLMPRWEESLASFPESGLPFLNPGNLVEWRRYCGLHDDIDGPLIGCARLIRESRDLSSLAWHGYRMLYDPAEKCHFKDWPDLVPALSDKAGLFYLIVGLAMVPLVRDRHAAMGVDPAVTKDTCAQVFHFSENYRRDHPGRWGLPKRQLYWLRHYPAAALFRLGRFEYKLERKDLHVHLFRSRSTGRALALVRSGFLLDKDGFGAPEGADGIAATFQESGDSVKGLPVSPETGRAGLNPVTLRLSEWEKECGPGDWLLDLHIPAGGNMTPELCGDSFRRAFEFFDRFFPDQRPPAVICYSWMFNPALAAILPEDSNLVRLLRSVYLFPSRRHPRDGFFFLFGEKGETAEPADLPRQTSLQRAILDYVSRGNPWRGGGMLLMRRDLAGDRHGIDRSSGR